MTKLIKPDSISFSASISEAELKERLVHEVLESIGGLDRDGEPLPGIVAHVVRGEARKGGYTITVTGPMPARLLLPKGGDA
jgi:hypothetical protein